MEEMVMGVSFCCLDHKKVKSLLFFELVQLLIFVFLLFVYVSGSLANSLYFDDSWTGNVTMEDTRSKLEAYEKEYMGALAAQRPDLGFYLVGSYEKDFESGENKYTYGLEWRLFDEGWWQSRRERMKKVLETKLEFLQLKRDRFYERIVLMRQHVHFVHNLLLLKRAREKRKTISGILSRREKALKGGFSTKLEIERLKMKLSLTEDELNQLETFPMEKLTREEAELLNRIEYATVRPIPELVEQVYQSKPDFKIQDVMAERADFFPSWTDDLDVTLFLLRRNEFYERQRWCYGVKVAIPLYYNHKRSKVVELQKLLYVDRKSVMKMKLKRELELRVSRLKRAQWELERSKKLYRLTSLELREALAKAKSPIQNLKTEPMRDAERLKIQLVDAAFAVLDARLKCYMYLIDLMEVTGFSEPQNLLL